MKIIMKSSLFFAISITSVNVIANPNPDLFMEGALVTEATTEPCTLSGGTDTTCYRITIVGAPANAEFLDGPYCPPTVDSPASEGGLWIDGKGTLYNVDGDFIKNLSTLYDDEHWQMYDAETGEVTVVDGAQGCAVAGDPTNAPDSDNFCLECTLAELGAGVERTILIPTEPVPLESPDKIERRNNLGVALNGVLFGPPAPIDFILSTYTIGVFDACGGHSNPHEGYHYHAAVGCSEISDHTDDHPALIGYALDGYGIYSQHEEGSDSANNLDECGGESDDVRGYHYHASAPGKNEIIGCYRGEQGTFDN